MSITKDLIIGSSKAICDIRKIISIVADSNATVLISGESGTGKKLVALAIHQMSRMVNASLLQFDCAATDERFMEAELFGSEEKGNTKKGLLETANGCTVLLVNIDRAPLQLQKNLLRVFQEKNFFKQGGVFALKTDCRFIATSRLNMVEKIDAKLFREDLYYRLKVVDIQMPALRDRPTDIKPLIYEIVRRLGKDDKAFMSSLVNHDLLEYFKKYSWPGNVRELQEVVETLVLKEDWDSIRQLLLGHSNASSQMIIERCIEFPPEYHQAGVSILNFFGEILRRKYPDHKAMVRIEQDGLKVKLTVEPLTGKVEIFERALDEYGLVLTGQITPEQFTNDPFLVMNIKHELRLAHARIESQKELLNYQEKLILSRDHQLEQMMNLIGRALHVPQPHHFNISVSPNITSSVDAGITISNEIEIIRSDLSELSNILNTLGEDVSKVEELRQELEKSLKSGRNEAGKWIILDKLKKLIDHISDADNRIGETIKATKQGVAVVQRIAKRYNDIAQWFGWPQVPKPFLGNDTKA